MSKLDQITGRGAQSECRVVNQPELSPLHLVDLTALSAAKCLSQREDRRERRAKVMRDLGDQLAAVRSREQIIDPGAIGD